MYFSDKSWFHSTILGIVIFGVGTFIGTFCILNLYAIAGKKWMQQYNNHQKIIDVGIATLLLILGIFQIIKMHN